jgi:hypothetical protein
MTKEQHNQLMLMKGNTYLYSQIEYRIISYASTDDRVYMDTDKGAIDFPIVDFKVYMKKFIRVPDDKPVLPKYEMSIGNNSYNKMRDILLDNIEKIKVDKNFLPQAAEINNQVKTVIELAKTEIELFKALQK